MRDAFGGTFLMYLMMIMVVVFVTFMAETLKYVQAYRVKNTIINYIEEYEGFNDVVIGLLENENGYLDRTGYSGYTETGFTTKPQNTNDKYCSRGYCVILEYRNGKVGYYKVITNITLKFTEVLGVPPITVNIPGETRYVTLSGIDE